MRPKTKNHYPGMWDITVCGSITTGERVDEATRREVLEKTGLTLNFILVESFVNIFPGDNGEERRRLSHLYCAVTDEIPKINDEVDEFKVWQFDDLKVDINRNPEMYVPSFKFELNKVVDYRSKLSV